MIYFPPEILNRSVRGSDPWSFPIFPYLISPFVGIQEPSWHTDLSGDARTSEQTNRNATTSLDIARHKKLSAILFTQVDVFFFPSLVKQALEWKNKREDDPNLFLRSGLYVRTCFNLQYRLKKLLGSHFFIIFPFLVRRFGSRQYRKVVNMSLTLLSRY